MNVTAKTNVKKSTGHFEKYSPEKIKKSLERSGLNADELRSVQSELESTLTEQEISTNEIFDTTKELIFKKSHFFAGVKYSLKNAILLLGPNGFVFEQFLAKALAKDGYQTKTNIIMQGRCIQHEIDISAIRADYQMLIESKFHNDQEIKNDLKTVLYVKARMDDLRSFAENKFDDFYLVSNTSFSKDAIKFAECSQLKLLGFNYPLEKTLYQLIEDGHHYPITCLPWIKKSDLKVFFEKNILTLHELYASSNLLTELNYSSELKNEFIKNYECYFNHCNKIPSQT